ncbi:DUF488 domain-containing protein [Rhizobium tubonense]|uniref:DUF488 domain-containing protein n=1 Tax=Rhizobium tubonense TaxID=484088 RepID=UPI0018A846FC|nr:DUF488 domain-containing protein [Rhizobium tubonense]
MGLEAFAGIVKASKISLVIDVRTVPRSRANPQFNIDTFAGGLKSLGSDTNNFQNSGDCALEAMKSGLATNGFWINESFHNYADYAMSQAFRDGIERLRSRSKVQCLAAPVHQRISPGRVLTIGVGARI